MLKKLNRSNTQLKKVTLLKKALMLIGKEEMKILIILATGALITFQVDESVKPDCFSQGYSIVKKLATYHGPGPNPGWVLTASNIQLAGWYCK